MTDQRKRPDPCEPEGVAVMPHSPRPNLSGGAVIDLPSNEELRAAMHALRLTPVPQQEECVHA